VASGGAVMADTPPDDDELPDDPEDRFLVELWRRLDRAVEISSGPDAVRRLEDVLQLCEASAALIRSWRAERN